MEYEQIELAVTPYLDQIRPILENVDIYDHEKNQRLMPAVSQIAGFIRDALSTTNTTDVRKALIAIKIALNPIFIKSTKPNTLPELVDKTNKIIVINNTIVTLIKKDHRRDPKRLVSRLSNQITNSANSFTHLLGIEMQNVFARKGSFVDANLLNISLKTFLYHRHQINGTSDDLPFELFIKDLLIAQAKLNLREERLTILENSFLTSITPKYPKASSGEIAKINTFYNGSALKEERMVNFGDIFHVRDNVYYMCITPLCDCLYPDANIKNKYFFVKGISFNDLEEGISLGDEAFISYIDESTCISWAGVAVGSSRTDKHKPIYVKPNQLYIPDGKIVKGKIKAHDFAKEEAIEFGLEYRFTLRQQYAQRIANHAFSHPLRIGIDFVKK